MSKTLLASLFLGLALNGCGLMDPEYKPNVTAQQNAIAELRKQKQEAIAESAAIKAQIPALQSAHAALQSKLDVANADLERARATTGTPAEVVAGLASLVSSIQQEVAASKGAIDDSNGLRALLAKRHAELTAEENARQAALKDYKINAAADVGRSGISLAEALAGGGALTGVLALLKSFLGKSKAQPQVDALKAEVATNKAEAGQLWDLITAAREQIAASTGKSLPVPPVQPPARPAI